VLAPITGAISLADKANQGAKMLGYGGKKGKGKLVITHGGAAVSKTGRYEGEGMMDDLTQRQLPASAYYKGASKKAHLAKLGVVGEGWWDDVKGAVKGAVSSVVEEVKKDPKGALEKAQKGYELGKKRRAPAGPNDGRRKRAEIVRKVMSEKGLSMIEASKYVKAHNLY
jgi:hypothetical protein